MTTEPGNPAADSRDRFRAGDADREQVIETLKTAYVHGRLTNDELDMRAGQALTARTYADLAALTSDIPPGLPAAGVSRHRRLHTVGRWPERPPSQAFALSSRPSPSGLASSLVRAARAPIPVRRSWPSRLPFLSPHSASWRMGWQPQWSGGSPPGSFRPAGAGLPDPWMANGTAAPPLASFLQVAAPTGPASACRRTGHHRISSTSRPCGPCTRWPETGARREFGLMRQCSNNRREDGVGSFG